MNTPITDAFALKIKTPCGEKYWVPVDIARKLERELAAVTEQRDELAESLDFQFKLNRECIDQITTRTQERDEAREQRDRLAEALQNVINEDGTPISIDQADVALQSLTPNQP